MTEGDALVSRHLRLGWLALAVFVCLGTALEALHAFKVGAYLDAGAEARRLMWRLAHAHGTSLSVLNMAFAFTLTRLPGFRRRRLASFGLVAATVLLPGGFFLGGFGIHGGDPGLGVALVPAGAVCLLTTTVLTALETLRRADSTGPATGTG